jgi:hypothetical protein
MSSSRSGCGSDPEKKISNFFENLKNLEDTVQTSQDEITNLTIHYEGEITEINKKISQLKAHYEAHTGQLYDEIRQLTSRRESDTGQLKDEISELKSRNQSETEKLKDEIRQLTARYQDQIGQLKDEIRQLTTSHQKKVEGLNDLFEITRLKNNRNICMLKSETIRLKEMITSLQKENIGVDSYIESFKFRLSENRKTISELEKNNSDLNSENQSLKAEIQDLKKKSSSEGRKPEEKSLGYIIPSAQGGGGGNGRPSKKIEPKVCLHSITNTCRFNLACRNAHFSSYSDLALHWAYFGGEHHNLQNDIIKVIMAIPKNDLPKLIHLCITNNFFVLFMVIITVHDIKILDMTECIGKMDFNSDLIKSFCSVNRFLLILRENDIKVSPIFGRIFSNAYEKNERREYVRKIPQYRSLADLPDLFILCIESVAKINEELILETEADAKRSKAEAEAERREAERLEAQRLEDEKLKTQRLAYEKLEAERREVERREAQRLEDEEREKKCPICIDNIKDTKTGCGHDFCGVCINEVINRTNPCPLCREVLKKENFTHIPVPKVGGSRVESPPPSSSGGSRVESPPPSSSGGGGGRTQQHSTVYNDGYGPINRECNAHRFLNPDSYNREQEIERRSRERARALSREEQLVRQRREQEQARQQPARGGGGRCDDDSDDSYDSDDGWSDTMARNIINNDGW